MESRLRETTHILMRALEGFYPFVKNAEEQIGLLEGDVANLTVKKKGLENEISEQIKKADMLIALDKKKTKDALANAELLLEETQRIYFELYKAKVTKICPPAGYVEERVMPKVEDLKKKIKEAIVA